jgi:predicted ArsR family transcriptional regulator
MDQKTRERILASVERNPGATDRRIAKNLGVATSDVAKARAGDRAEPASEPKGRASGISLASKRVLSRRPAESAAKYIKRLPNGKGFSPRDLAAEWGMSEETVKQHARNLQCLKFVEVAEDEWQALVMSPDTAAKYHS